MMNEEGDSGRLQEILDGQDIGVIQRAKERTRQQVMETEGHKDDADKRRWDALPAEALREVADVMTFGTKKYQAFNWRKGMDWARLYRAGIGHIMDWWTGERNDKETGKHHLAHAVCCLLMLLDMDMRNIPNDNRTILEAPMEGITDADRTDTTNP
jgi:hypothetical protein